MKKILFLAVVCSIFAACDNANKEMKTAPADTAASTNAAPASTNK